MGVKSNMTVWEGIEQVVLCKILKFHGGWRRSNHKNGKVTLKCELCHQIRTVDATDTTSKALRTKP